MAIRDGFAGALGYTLLIRLCRASEATGLSPVLLLLVISTGVGAAAGAAGLL